MKRYQLRKSKHRTGAILPLVALLIFILLGCLAFAIDVVDARASAHLLAGLNHVASDPLLLDDADIIFGK